MKVIRRGLQTRGSFDVPYTDGAGWRVEVGGHVAKPVARVEVSTNGGSTWAAADLDAAAGPHAWIGWSLPCIHTPHGGVRFRVDRGR
jgi:hypothetical protein